MRSTIIIKQLTKFSNMGCISYETHSDIVKSMLDTKQYIFFVLWDESRKFEFDTWKIDMSALFDLSIVKCFDDDMIMMFFFDQDIKYSGFNFDDISDLYIFYEVRVITKLILS